MLYVYLALILVSETTALSFLKMYSQSQHLRDFALGILFYVLVALFLVKSFKYESLGIVNVLWSAFSMLFVVTTGILFFKEQITLMQATAIVMILLGVIVLQLQS